MGPVTAHRPEKALKPDQIPARPQSNTSDSHTNGRNPISALITVAFRMNRASPAPSVQIAPHGQLCAQHREVGRQPRPLNQ
jgi:hypothetical protein